MVRVLTKNGQVPPQELSDLFQVLLRQDRPPSNSDRRYVQWLEAVRYLKDEPTAGVREIANKVGVSPSTVSRWRQNGKL